MLLKRETCLSDDPEEEWLLLAMSPYFGISQTPVERVLWAYFTHGKKKTKVLCNAALYQEPCDTFPPTEPKTRPWAGEGRSSHDSESRNQAVCWERLSDSVAQLHFSSGFPSFAPLISWIMIDWIFQPFWSSSSCEDDFLSFSNHQVAVPCIGMIQKFLNDPCLVANIFLFCVIYWFMHLLCTK